MTDDVVRTDISGLRDVLRATTAKMDGRDWRFTISDVTESPSGAITFDLLTVKPGFSHTMRQKICEAPGCGKPFEAERPSAKTCSTACRVRLHRATAKAAAAADGEEQT